MQNDILTKTCSDELQKGTTTMWYHHYHLRKNSIKLLVTLIKQLRQPKYKIKLEEKISLIFTLALRSRSAPFTT